MTRLSLNFVLCAIALCIGVGALALSFKELSDIRTAFGSGDIPIEYDEILACQDRLRRTMAAELESQRPDPGAEGQFDETLDLAGQCLALSPFNPYSLALRGTVHLLRGETANAIEDLTASLERGPIEVEWADVRLSLIIALYPKLPLHMQHKAQAATAWIATKRSMQAATIALQSPDREIFIHESLRAMEHVPGIVSRDFERSLRRLRQAG